MKLSDKLIELRKEKGWSQEDFAEKLDVSRQAISRWENGTALPDAQNLLRISRLFCVSADYLLNDDYVGDDQNFTTEAEGEDDADQAREADVAVQPPKKRGAHWLWIPIACLTLLVVCLIIKIATDNTHRHSLLRITVENEVLPTCSADGSFDEVAYCMDCGEEVMRTTKIVAKLTHMPLSSVKENEVAPTCAAEGSYDEVAYCRNCGEEVLRVTQSVAKLAHVLSGSVIKNKVEATCTAGGSYDEVVSCSVCNAELLKTRRTTEKLEHQYQDRKCVSCNAAQPSEGLSYMSHGNGECTVDSGDCTDEHVVIPAYSPSGDKVISIKSTAFRGNKTIKSVQIPETVMAIGASAFEDCINLERVNLPQRLTDIREFTFDGCESLKEITIPSRVKQIGQEAFAECVSMERIVIPASVTYIGKFAFRNFSGGQGTVIFERYGTWCAYDDDGKMQHVIPLTTGVADPFDYLTYIYAEYVWRLV